METNQQFEQIIATCRDLFAKKLKDYGAAWRIMRPTSVTDQIFIKANRIRSIETKGETRAYALSLLVLLIMASLLSFSWNLAMPKLMI